MRLWVCILAIAGCGRLGFEGTSGDAALQDSAPSPDRAPSPDGAAPFDAQQTPGLVSHYTMEDDPADGVVEDVTGNGHRATCAAGFTCPTATDGRFGQAVQFDGQSQLLRVSDAPAFRPSSELTVACWVRLDRNDADFVAMAKPHGSAELDSWLFIAWNGGPTCFETTIAGDTREDICAGGAVPANEWVHLAGRWRDGEKALFINGVQVSQQTDASPIEFDTHDVLLGADENAGQPVYHLEGALDEVRIYDRALDDPEIQQLAGL